MKKIDVFTFLTITTIVINNLNTLKKKSTVVKAFNIGKKLLN